MDNDRERRYTVVFIAPDAVLTAWEARAADRHDVFTVRETAAVDFFEVIAERRPDTVVLDEGVACSDRGATLIGRLQTDPQWQHIEIRLLPAERLPDEDQPRTATALVALARPIRPSYSTVRHSVRRKTSGDVKAEINGTAAVLVDISAAGAQVLSPLPLHRRQVVELVLAETLRLTARVVWVTLDAGPSPQYRAGLQFLDDDGASAA